MDQKDILQAAQILIDCYAEEALSEAAGRTASALAEGEATKAHDWARVAAAIKTLTGDGETAH